MNDMPAGAGSSADEAETALMWRTTYHYKCAFLCVLRKNENGEGCYVNTCGLMIHFLCFGQCHYLPRVTY